MIVCHHHHHHNQHDELVQVSLIPSTLVGQKSITRTILNVVRVKFYLQGSLSAGEVVYVNRTCVIVWALLAFNMLGAGAHLKKEAETGSQSVTIQLLAACFGSWKCHHRAVINNTT